MTSKQIQHALFDQFGNASKLMIPNYTPAHWFECDLIRVTKAGYLEEFEIKISVADFKADAKKGPSERDKQYYQSFDPESQSFQNFDARTKHERLAAGDTRGPCRFWFAVPEEIAPKIEVPPWAGLIAFREYRKRIRICSLHAPIQGDAMFKHAPKLHPNKAEETVINHMRGVFYYRYWNLRQGVKEEEVA